MNFSFKNSLPGGALLLLLVSQSTVAEASDDRSKSEPKKETKYDRLFKDKKAGTARSKSITVHKLDSKVYSELLRILLKKQMVLGGVVNSAIDTSTVTVGSTSSNSVLFYFDIQNSSMVMKTPNSVLFKGNTNSADLGTVLALDYRDDIWQGFNIMAYNNDSSVVVFDVTSLLGKPNNLVSVMPTKNGNYSIKATPKPGLSFIRDIKSFDTNVIVSGDFTYGVSTPLMSMPIGGERPTTVSASYNVAPMPESAMRPHIVDSRVDVNYPVRLEIPKESIGTKRIFYSRRWDLVPKDKKAYAKGKLSQPVSPIRFYLDDAFPEAWKQPIHEGVLEWNRAFEKIGFRNATEVIDFPQKQGDFDPNNTQCSCIRYILSDSSSAPKGDICANPNTGEIIAASMFIYSGIEKLLHKWRLVETSTVDPSVRSNRLSAARFADGLKVLVTKEAGSILGLLDNPGASATYSTDSLRDTRFMNTMGLAPSVMDDVHYNYIAQPADNSVRLAPTRLDMYDYFAIDWNYHYFDTGNISINDEKDTLEAFVDKKVTNLRLRYYAERNAKWDPHLAADAPGNDTIVSTNLANKDYTIVEDDLSKWIKNDEDTCIKDQLYLQTSQDRYALFKQVLSSVGGMYLNNMKISAGVSQYRVVSKGLQRRSLLWRLQEAMNFKKYANRSFEHKGYLSISYYDQSLESMGYNLMVACMRVAITSYLNPSSYAQREYFDDIYSTLFKSVAEICVPSQDKRVLQCAFMSQAQNVISKATDNSGSGGGSGSSAALKSDGLSATPGFSDPSQNLAPAVDITPADNSGLYFYNNLLKLRTALEKYLKANLPLEACTRYEMMLFKINRTTGVKR